MTSEQPSASLRRQMEWLWEHWQRYRRTIPLLLALTLANAVVLVIYPYLLKRIIDGIERSLSFEAIGHNVLILVCVGVAHFLIYASMQTVRARLNMRFEFGVRLRAFEHLLRMGPSFFSRFRTGDLVTRLNDDVNEKLCWYMCSGIFRVIEAGAVIVFGVLMMLSLNAELTLYTAGPLPILVGLFVITADKLRRRYETVQQSISNLNDSLESCFSGIRVTKAFAAEAAQQQLIEQAIERQRQAEVRAVRWQTVIDSLYGNIWQLAIIGVLLAGGAMAIAGQVTLGDIVAFDSYVLLLVWPMFDIGQFLVRGRQSAVCIRRIDELEQCHPEVVEPGDCRPIAPRPDDPLPEDHQLVHPRRPQWDVGFEEVCYRHPGAQADALRGVSLQVLPGQILAVAGEIGAGKSTLLSMVPRLIDPTAGRIRIAGRDVREWDPVTLRQAIGYVPQEPQLLSGTVLDNIRFGRGWVDDQDVQTAIDIANLTNDLADWPDGLETVVGSRGIRLSGGQKQRVSLARALAGRPSILLLDDCTASLDAETEELVWRHLCEAIPDCTTLLVTHRPSTLQRADQILVLDRGAVREAGPFSKLDQPGTFFHRLYVQWKLWEQGEFLDE